MIGSTKESYSFYDDILSDYEQDDWDNWLNDTLLIFDKQKSPNTNIKLTTIDKDKTGQDESINPCLAIQELNLLHKNQFNQHDTPLQNYNQPESVNDHSSSTDIVLPNTSELLSEPTPKITAPIQIKLNHHESLELVDESVNENDTPLQLVDKSVNEHDASFEAELNEKGLPTDQFLPNTSEFLSEPLAKLTTPIQLKRHHMLTEILFLIQITSKVYIILINCRQ
jgi:hypothetical protein